MVGSGELPRLCNHNPRGYMVELDGAIQFRYARLHNREARVAILDKENSHTSLYVYVKEGV